MASPNDSLIFPVHFDMDKAVKNAEDIFKGKEKELNKMFTANINLKISPKSIENLEDVQKRLKEIRLQPVTPETRNAIRVLVKELEGLAKILEKVDRLNAQSSKNAATANATNAMEAQRRARTAQINAKTDSDELINAEKLRRAKARAVKAELDLQRAQERTTRTTSNQTKAFHSQANMLNGLKQTMGAYVSLLGAKTLANNIREVTQEFELQKVALTAILQDKAKADMLFGQVVNLAVKSPFQIKEMVGFTKQLAAYRINTDELYDTTRRLADVSSGLGVEMSRIILAYGQVSAASVLRGQEVRQFTEAGIPLIQLLAEKFEELNGKAVTTGEVFELISQRKVSFEMVKEVFEDMTNAGGIFYDMQAKQANTLYGIYSNLRDAWDVAFNEIGQENLGLMKGLGETLTDLSENWRTLEAILVTLVGTYGAYRIAMAIATRETKVYTLAQALANIEDSKKIAKSPAMITAILGESKANRLASINANMLALSKYKLATANNVLTRTFYRLTTAMLTNPYVALVTGIAAIGVALYAFRDRAVTTEQIISKLNKSTAEFISTSDKLDNLSNAYNKLSGTINRTKGQQERLNGVIKELAKLYPSAVVEVDKYGNAVKIAMDKVASLTTAEKNLKREILDRQIAQAKDKRLEYERELADIQDQIATRSKKVVSTGGFQSSSVMSMNVELGIDALERLNNRAEELRGEMFKLDDAMLSASETISNLGKDGTSESFSGWRKVMIDSSMYDSKALEELSQFPKAMDDVAKEYKKATEDVKVYSKTLKEGTEEDKKSVKEGYENAVARQKAYYSILSTLKQLSLLEEKGGSKKDPRIASLEAEFKLIKDVHSRYEEFSKSMIKNDAINKTLDIFGSTKQNDAAVKMREMFSKSNVNLLTRPLIDAAKLVEKGWEDAGDGIATLFSSQFGVATKDGEEVEILITPILPDGSVLSEDELVDYVDNTLSGASDIFAADKLGLVIAVDVDPDGNAGDKLHLLQEEFYRLGDSSKLMFAFDDKSLKGEYEKFITSMRKLGVSESDLLKFKVEMDDIAFKRFQDSLKAKIKKLGDDLEKQQKANRFFEKIIGTGMDAQIAASITMNLYGFDSSDIRQTMINSLEEGMGGVKLDLTPEGTIDFSKVAEKIKSNEFLSPDLKDAYLDLANSIRDNDAETIESLYSNLGKYSEYEQRRMDIVNKANDERKKIQSSAVAESQKGTLMTQVSKKESKDLATLEYDMFKESDLYTTMFENLDKVSTASLDAIRSKLEAFKQVSKESFDPTQIRELTRSFEKIDEQFRARNPFQSLIDGIAEYREKSKAAAEANLSIADISNRISGARADVDMARKMSAEAKARGESSDVWDESIASSEKLIEQLEKQLGVQLNITNESKSAKDALAEAALGVSDKLGGIDSSIGAFGDTLSLLGVDMDSELGATFGDLQNVIGGAAEAAGGFGKVMKGDLSGIGDMISGTGKQIQGFVGIFTGINRKVAKANKEIKKQAEIIKELQKEYQKLEKSMDDLMGVDWAQNNADQINNLEAQYKATQKQLEAEKSKGKKADKDKMDEYEQQMQEMQDRIVERQKAFAEQLLGTNVGDAARSFASAWLDAKLSFEDTTKAIEDRMRDMMKNMLIEAILGKVIQEYVDKMFKDVGDIWDRQEEFKREAGDKMLEADKKWLMDNQDKWFARSGINAIDMFDQAQAKKLVLANDIYTDEMIRALTDAGIATREILSPNKEKIENLVNGISGNASDLNDILTAVFEGMDLSGLMDFKDTSLTGISKAVGSLSEETALTLAAAANSSLYYNVGQYNELVMIHEILTRWDAERSVAIQDTDTSSGVSGLIAVQNLALDELRKANISLEDIMESNREIQEFFVSLTSPLGSRSGTRAINVNI